MECLYPFNDFEAEIRIFNESEGGRRIPAFNGIRWDFSYHDRLPNDDCFGLYAIHPDFFDEQGNSLAPNTPLPVGKLLSARMLIVRNEMREKVHRARLSEGTKFYCHEGGLRVAEGKVTRITGLFSTPPARKSPVPDDC